jgi:hypothetical protein
MLIRHTKLNYLHSTYWTTAKTTASMSQVNPSTADNLNTTHNFYTYILDQTLQNNGYQSLVEVRISDIWISAVKPVILVYFKVLFW